MCRHVCWRRATCAWAIVLGLVVLVMAGPTSAQPVDIPPTWAEIFCGRLILPTCALPAADVAVEKVWAPSLSKIKYGVK